MKQSRNALTVRLNADEYLKLQHLARALRVSEKKAVTACILGSFQMYADALKEAAAKSGVELDTSSITDKPND